MNKTPICLLPDKAIREIRTFRGRVRHLLLFRAKGYCEICRQPFGIDSSQLRGHHIKRPILCLPNVDAESEDNIIICCDDCYRDTILASKKIIEWELSLRPKTQVTMLMIERRRYNALERELVKTKRARTQVPKQHWFGFKFNFGIRLVTIGISWTNRRNK